MRLACGLQRAEGRRQRTPDVTLTGVTEWSAPPGSFRLAFMKRRIANWYLGCIPFDDQPKSATPWISQVGVASRSRNCANRRGASWRTAHAVGLARFVILLFALVGDEVLVG